MKDWNYLHTNDFELTLELGCVKYPEHGQLAAFWQENREPLLKYLEAVHLGVKGGHQICFFFIKKVSANFATLLQFMYAKYYHVHIFFYIVCSKHGRSFFFPKI